jgi:hypothetical protein
LSVLMVPGAGILEVYRTGVGQTVAMASKKIFGLIFIVFLLLLSACDDATISDPFIADQVEVDPTFREFYDLLGGRETLGPAISPLFAYGEVKYQYTVAALMVRDPSAPGNQKLQLAALGLDMGITEDAVPRIEGQGGRYIDGHLINEIFVPMYERIGGARYVGKPLTEMHFNPDKRRFEQYFENLGMYWLEGDAQDSIHLHAYGAWKCDASCRQPPLGSSTVILPSEVDDRFAGTVNRLGADFTGFAITDAYTTPDGYIEQVYENIVLIATPKKPRRVSIRGMSERLGILPEPLVESNGMEGYSFYEIRDGRGYNVLQKFMDYLAFHGGIEVSGPPIGELNTIKDGVQRQCFANLCMEQQISASGKVAIRPAQIGYTYRKMAVSSVDSSAPSVEEPAAPKNQSEPQVEPAPVQEQQAPAVDAPAEVTAPDARELGVQVWETFAMVSPDQSQEIGVGVFENNTPLANIEPDIIVVLPDGSSHTYYMYPTTSDGQTRLLIDPINAPNGTIIPYQVCIYNLNGSKFCVKDSFLIWTNP